MIEIAYSREKGILRNMPQEVQETIEEILQILDSEYGANRNRYEDAGGYVVVVEKIEDFKEIIDKAYIDCNEVIAEYVDKIVCNNDYAISLIIPLELTRRNLEYKIEHELYEHIIGDTLNRK